MPRPEKSLKDEDVIHKIRSQSGMEEDEIKVLYPTEAERLTFLEELRAAAKGEADPDWQEDDFELPAEEAAEAAELLQKAEEKKKKRKAKQDALAAQQAAELAQTTGISVDDAIAASLEAAKHLDK